MHTRRLTHQLTIIHLSDLHFGEDHRFNVSRTVTGDKPDKRPGYPTLLDKLKEDFQEPPDIDNLIVCITGDLANTATYPEFDEASEFVKALGQCHIHGRIRGPGSIFMVPGNHDVNYSTGDIGARWERYVAFANRLNNTNVDPRRPWDLIVLNDRIDELGAVILCLNSAIYVQKDTSNEKRGEVDLEQLKRIETSLEQLAQQRQLNDAIRVALIHHHPILIPPLAEIGRGYDAIVDSGKLLTILRRYGFHLILHGHKHNPFVFADDSQSAWMNSGQPIVVVAGGSASSRSMPEGSRERWNCYNRVVVKWHPAARQTRFQLRPVASRYSVKTVARSCRIDGTGRR